MRQSTVSGSLLTLFLYDVADAIKLDVLRGILGLPPSGRQPQFRQPAPEYVQFARPPVVESLDPIAIKDGGNFATRLTYYDYGIVTIQIELPFEGAWEEVIAFAARWMNATELEQEAVAALRRSLVRVAAALVNPYRQHLTEDYSIVHLRAIRDESGATRTAADLIEHCPDYIAQIVRGETATFSATERSEILESRMSYYQEDLLVVGWSAALVYDTPEGAAPTIRLLEYANTQLLEFRYYDGVLTGLLSEVYRSLERGGVLARWRMARDAERVSTIRLDVRELTERVDNSIKFLSDMFAARLYRMAATKIGVPDYKTLVEQKLESAGELYAFMMDRFYQGRAFALELMVVIILVIELVFLFRGIR